MQPQTKLLADASVEELRNFAQVSLGLEIEGTENRNVVLARMRQAGYNPDAEGFRVAIFTMSEPAPTGMPEGGREKRDGRWYQAITVHASPEEGGDRPLPVRVNGKTMLIPRGKREMVPEEYVEAIRNAKETVYNMNSHGLSDPREVPSYPHAIG